MTALVTGKKTGRAMELQVGDVFRFREGMISDIDVYYKDVHAVLDVLGA
jgi:ketosteroid isomerase-like protein